MATQGNTVTLPDGRSLPIFGKTGTNTGPGTRNDLPSATWKGMDARVHAVNTMLAMPASHIEVARAECRVGFAADSTIISQRPPATNTPGIVPDAHEVLKRMLNPAFAARQLEAATATAIIRGDASPLRGTYNYKPE